MRGGDHDARVALQVADGEGEQGGRTSFREKEDVKPGGGQHPGAKLGELRRSPETGSFPA